MNGELHPDWQNSLLIGIGNDGRNDDGLGWAFLEAVERSGVYPGRIVHRYQLQIEDAELISHARYVIFVDACQQELPGGFDWQPCTSAAAFEFTSHQLTPHTVLFLCNRLYQRTPRADLLLIEGQSWDLQFGLSQGATANLAAAVQDLQRRLVRVHADPTPNP